VTVGGGYLLDTNVASIGAPRRRDPPPEIRRARAWAEAHRREVFLPAIALAEIALGVARLDAAGAAARARELAAWAETLAAAEGVRLLAFDAEAALHMRSVQAAALRAGVDPGFPDLAIAAIARRHGLTVATRNLRHFGPMSVPVVDPFAEPA
jgi:predicted nucleic acid-binding protein